MGIMSIKSERDRWFMLAKQTNYDLPDATVTWLAHTHNAVFLIEQAGQKYVMRISETAASATEGRWLRAIRRHTSLMVPDMKIMFPSLGSHVLVSGVRWPYLEGESRAAADMTPDDMRRIGTFLATMHSVPLNFINDYIKRAANRLDYNGLYGPNSRYYPGAAASLFTAEQTQTMAEAQARVKAVMDTIGTKRKHFGLIHGDTLLPNILFHNGQVSLIDFEYCGYGYYLYDLAPLLWELKPQPNYAALEAALRESYTAIRPLPDRAYLETFIAARHMATMLWTAINHDHPFIAGQAREILAQYHQELRGFLDTGQLNRTEN